MLVFKSFDKIKSQTKMKYIILNLKKTVYNLFEKKYTLIWYLYVNEHISF